MDFDEDMSGLQIEDLGEYFLQPDTNENWRGFPLVYTDEDQQAQGNAKQPAKDTAASSTGTGTGHATSATSGLQHLTSPPLSSITEMLKHGNGMGVGLGFGSPRKDFSALFQASASISATPSGAKHGASDADLMNRATQDALELANFTLEHKKPAGSAMSTGSNGPGKGALSFGGSSIKPARNVKTSSPLCQNIMSSDEDGDAFGAVNTAAFKRGCSTIGTGAPEDDRGFRKKSREKMRRQEVNVKFEELVELLGLSNRVRKSAILQEAVSAIKSLKRERDEMRRDRDRLQQEVSKLATCLQYSHLGSMAANAVNMTPQQLAHMNASGQQLGGNQQHQQQHQHQHQQGQPGASASQMQTVHTHPLNVPCNPGTNCFPISSAFTNLSSHLGSGSSHASSSAGSGQISIAPKQSKPTSSTSSYTPIAPDTHMNVHPDRMKKNEKRT